MSAADPDGSHGSSVTDSREKRAMGCGGLRHATRRLGTETAHDLSRAWLAERYKQSVKDRRPYRRPSRSKDLALREEGLAVRPEDVVARSRDGALSQAGQTLPTTKYDVPDCLPSFGQPARQRTFGVARTLQTRCPMRPASPLTQEMPVERVAFLG